MGDFTPVNPSYKHENGESHLNNNDYAAEQIIGSGDSHGSRSPIHSFGIFRGMSGDKKPVKADGQPPKRRGPKPDSKPALTRRQELNRQAQRTHRERKELYIKALEQEVLKLKETFGQTVAERDMLKEENRKLRDMLAAHGIQLDLNTGYVVSSSGSISGSYPSAPHSTGAPNSPPSSSMHNSGSPTDQKPGPYTNPATGIDYDQVGIDFVLALERPCMDHMQMLCVRSQEHDEEISGHALMFTCPPTKHLIERPDVPYPHKQPELAAGDLLKLLDLSNRLPLDGEITPVMAWAAIMNEPRVRQLSLEDYATLKRNLTDKVRCYGFGAVLEEFEVSDAINNALMAKDTLTVQRHVQEVMVQS